MSLAGRIGYALMKSGFHGSNGVGPKVSYNIYQSYIIPRLLYSMVNQYSTVSRPLVFRSPAIGSRTFFYLLLRRSISDHYLRSCGYVTKIKIKTKKPNLTSLIIYLTDNISS